MEPNDECHHFSHPTFSYLSARRDGSFVLFSFGDTPVEANGPFSTVAEARAWAAENGARERVRGRLVDVSGWQRMTMTGQLTRYDAACRAVAEAHRIDEVKDIRDKAVALSVYARQARDGELIAHATAIRKRAERRLGELMEDDRKAGKLAKGTRGRPEEGSAGR